ncbi:hypothetical protein JQS43_01825 [Natronosporangium hydrolyticum]|uniref:Uncharacterized protein n=1 Tax=Natronosporangium hydrolyticum TaxID=2811111 RepID=A0A895YMK7_9ACTN|nr:hypothetical protein [Natronosporangium hydrolyticum]QSB15138.1 hypothetical protein JQS43_01825 [Natronosporangium hydrolyticum]
MSSITGFVRRIGRGVRRRGQLRWQLHRQRRIESLARRGSPELAALVARVVDEKLADLAGQLAAAEEQLRAARRRADDAHRLAVASSRAAEQLSQAEIELWQAIDRVELRAVQHG